MSAGWRDEQRGALDPLSEEWGSPGHVADVVGLVGAAHRRLAEIPFTGPDLARVVSLIGRLQVLEADLRALFARIKA